MQRPLPLYLGTLFHDIGKGSGQDHSTRGAQIAGRRASGIGLDAADAADIEWLVLKHLRMAAIAQRRDLSDPDLIHAFAEEVGTLDRLEKLYLLTYADIATVGPRTWTDWKARLLRELFQKTREVLRGGRAPPVSRAPPSRPGASSRSRRCSSARWGVRVEDHDRFVAAMPARYFLTVAPGLAPRHLRLLSLGRGRRPRDLHPPPRRPRPLRAGAHRARPSRACSRPSPGVLAAHRIDIQHAEVFSTPSDPALGLAGRPRARRVRAPRPGGGAGRAGAAGVPPAPTWRASSRARRRSTR